MFRKWLFIGTLVMVLANTLVIQAHASDIKGQVRVQVTRLFLHGGSVEMEVWFENVGDAPVSFVGQGYCDLGVQATITAPDGSTHTMKAWDLRVGYSNRCKQRAQRTEHQAEPGTGFSLWYSWRPEGDLLPGLYTIRFQALNTDQGSRYPIPNLTDTVSFKRVFSDIEAHWAEGLVVQAAAQGWVEGYPDGTFRPDQPITSAELAKMLVAAHGLDPIPQAGADDWGTPWLAAAVELGWWDSLEDRPLTWLEALTMLVRTSGEWTAGMDQAQVESLAMRLGLLRFMLGWDEGQTARSSSTIVRAAAVDWVLRLRALP